MSKMTMRPFVLNVILLIFLLPRLLWAWPPTFGAEFTFSSPEILRSVKPQEGHIVNSKEAVKAQNAMFAQIRKLCATRGNCTTQVLKSAYGTPVYRVNYSDGWWFQIATDPAVVEIQTKPATNVELTKYYRRMTEDIFEQASKAGLSPHFNVGGGHIHFGLQSGFGGDARLFRNFMVDAVNHFELASGILSNDALNSPPIASFKDRQRKAFQMDIERFDQGHIKNISELVKEISEDVYETHESPWEPRCKYQAVCLTRINNPEFRMHEKTVEIRAIRPERNADDFLKLTRLIEARLEFLKRKSGYVRLADFVVPARVTSQEKVDRFYRYVTECGLDWNEYSSLMQGEYRSHQPVPQAAERYATVFDDLSKKTPVAKSHIGCIAKVLRVFNRW